MSNVRTLLVLALFGVVAAQTTPSAGGRQIQPDYLNRFVEKAAELGLVHESISGLDHVNSSVMFGWSQTGIALGDIDGDDDLDVVICGGIAPNTVLRNDNGAFVDITDTASINTNDMDRTPALGDYDNDGDLDLFIGTLDGGNGAAPGYSRLYQNDGTGAFTEVTHLSGTIGNGHSVFSKWYDLDVDGRLDILTGEFVGTHNRYYRNNGDGTFTDSSVASGLDVTGSTHVIAVHDMDLDGSPDVMVGNDWKVTSLTGIPLNYRDAYMRGQGDGTWVDEGPLNGYDTEEAIMGLTLGDVNYDGFFDVYKTDIGDNYLYINNDYEGTGQPWTEEQVAYGVACDKVANMFEIAEGGVDTAVGWGATFFNADMDPWIDLYVVNGHIPGGNLSLTTIPLYQRNFLYRGLGPSRNYKFADQTMKFGLFIHNDERASSIGDMDGDGDMDLFVQTVTGPLLYWENNLDRHGQGGIIIEAHGKSSAPDGIGAQVQWTESGGRPHLRAIGADGPTASSNAYQTLIAIGHETEADISVRFPSGMTLEYPATPVDTKLSVTEPKLIEFDIVSAPALGTGGVGDPTTFTVTTRAFDSSGASLGPSAIVDIDVPGATPTGPVTHLVSNVFQREYDVPATPGTYRASATFNGWTPHTRPSLNVTGAADAGQTFVYVVPRAVRAGSSDRVAVRVTPKDANGAALGNLNHTLSISAPGLTVVDPPTAHGDGSWWALYQAPAAPGVVDIDVTVDAVPLGTLAQVHAGDTPDAGQSDIYIEIGNPLHQIVGNKTMVSVIPRDGAGRKLGPICEVDVTLDLDIGSSSAIVRADVGGSQRDGEFVFVIEKPVEDVWVLPASGDMEIVADGVTLDTIAFSF